MHDRLARMRPGTVVLVPGPVDPPDWWSDPAGELVAAGHHVVAPQLAVEAPPYAVSWVAAAARPLHASDVPTPIVLVGRGTAGPLLPTLARTQRAARRHIGGYVFVDAALPRAGVQTHLDLLRAADPDAAETVHDALHGGTAPDLVDHPLAADHGFWTEQLPPAIDWPDSPCAYVRTGAPEPAIGSAEWWARSAAQRGWLVDESGGELSTVLADVLDRLPG